MCICMFYIYIYTCVSVCDCCFKTVVPSLFDSTLSDLDRRDGAKGGNYVPELSRRFRTFCVCVCVCVFSTGALNFWKT